MPKKNGKEVRDELQKEKPGLKVLFMSGHSADLLVAREGFGPATLFLAKPIAPQDLLQKVRQALGPQTA